jgi:hypothetical protein
MHHVTFVPCLLSVTDVDSEQLRQQWQHQNYIYEVQSKLNIGNSWHHSAQSLVSFRLLFKNVSIKLHNTLMLSALCVRVEIGLSL